MTVKFFSIFNLVICVGLLGCTSKSSLSFLAVKCEKGDLESCLQYLNLYEQNKSLVDDTEFENVIKQAAKLGDTKAMFSLAVRAAQPYESPKDINSAIHWFSEASVAGDSLSSLNLGLIYDHGIGVNSDYIKARYWYKQAADLGNPEGLFNLAVYLDEGLGGEIDKSAAVRAYTLAAERGHARSAYNLALMLGRGEGIDQNWNSALKMLKYSQKLGYEPANQLLVKWSKVERKTD